MNNKEMFKKILYNIVGIATVWLDKVNIYAGVEINCGGLPGCESSTTGKVEGFSVNIIVTLIKYLSVFAVIALMASGVMYMFSGGEEEKVKKAKNWIIWSIVGVLLSTGAWFIVDIINNISIN